MVMLEDVLLHEVPAHTVALPVTAPLDEVFVTVIVTDDVEAALAVDTSVIKPVLLTVTTEGSELVQVVPDPPLRFLLLPSSNMPVAVNCIVWPLVCNVADDGVTLMLDNVGFTKNPLQPAALSNEPAIARRLTTLICS